MTETQGIRIPKRMVVAAIIVILGVVVLVLQNFYPPGIDWEYTFSRVDEYWRDPYALEAFTSPPWIVVLLPHA